MLMLLCVQVVQIDNNKFSWREKKKCFSSVGKQNICKLAKKVENLSLKIVIDKIHKRIIKEFTVNVNHHIKIGKNHNHSSSLIMHTKA
jgi:hypothetical protein